MQAVVFERFGEPAEVLRICDAPAPTPNAGQVRVRMLASPINPSDLLMIRGAYGRLPTLPATPGLEGVGVVESSGGGFLGKLLMGRRVAVLNGASDGGNWREQTVVSARQVIPLAADAPVDRSAMYFVNPATAYLLTRRVLRIPRNECLLQSAAGSALGRMVIRLGQRYGFKTINVVRRADQMAQLKAMGADHVLCAEDDSLREEVQAMTRGAGVRYAIDCVGGAIGSEFVRCLAPGGRLVVYGTLSGEPLRFSSRDLMTPCASIEGFWLAEYMTKLNLWGKIQLIRKIGALAKQGVLVSEVGEFYPLSQINAAVSAAEKPGKSGKILLRIASL